MSCPKCGSYDRETRWHKDEFLSARGTGCGGGTINTQHNEHLHYWCNLCRYDWTGPVKS